MASAPTASFGEDEERVFEDLGTPDLPNEGDFDRTVALLEMDSDEVLVELKESLDEVGSYLHSFHGDINFDALSNFVIFC